MIHLSMKFILIAIFLLTVYLIPIRAFAEGNIITVTPQLIQLDLSESPPEAEYFYTNSTSQTIELTLSMQDVKELEDRGIPGLLEGNEAKNYKYGLSSWAKFSNNNIVIAPKETKKVTVFIDANRLSIGGHYASVLAEIKQIDKEGPVKLRAILTSLLFVRQGSGHETERAALLDLRPNAAYHEFPTAFGFKLNNMGNVDLTPRGRLTIEDPFGREIAVGIVNEDSLITLPESIRRYKLLIDLFNNKVLEFVFLEYLFLVFQVRICQFFDILSSSADHELWGKNLSFCVSIRIFKIFYSWD